MLERLHKLIRTNADASSSSPRILSQRPVHVIQYDTKNHEWSPMTLPSKDSAVASLKLVSWNIDFMAQDRAQRLGHALRHLQSDILHSSNGKILPEPCCILLQEVHHTNMENTLLADEWVREHFYVIPKSRKEWPPYAGYGVVTLVSKDVPLVGAYSLDFSETTMSRNALIVDVQLRDHESSAAQTVRLANVHLESLGSGAKARQSQLEATSKELTQEGIFAGIVAGDMNAFGPTDKGLPESFGLTDAWDLDDEDGLTWGHQPKCQFPPDRLDKICYVINGTGTSSTPRNTTLRIERPSIFGVGLKTQDDEFVTDHYGLWTTLSVQQEP